MHPSKKFVICAIVAIGVAVGSLAVAAPANAYVSNCTTGFSSTGAFAQCGFSSSGYYKVRQLCENPFTHASDFVYGPRTGTSSSTPSTVTCPQPRVYYGNPQAQEAQNLTRISPKAQKMDRPSTKRCDFLNILIYLQQKCIIFQILSLRRLQHI